jgi:DNA-binding PadR family transcriptional regulator
MTRTSAQMFALSANDAVLGLLVERPGSGNELERRLEERLSSARFAHGSAHHAVKRLARRGLVRVVEDSSASAGSATAAAGSGEAGRRYEPTVEGVAYFERWLGASIGVPPLREELHAKLAFCGPADVPRMIELIRETELECMTQLEELNDRRRRERRLLGEDEWTQLIGTIVTTGEVMWWDSRVRWLQAVRQYLQREGQRYTVR